MLLAFVLGYGLKWWHTPQAVPNIIEYEPNTKLVQQYDPRGDCKEGIDNNGITQICSYPYPRIVMSLDDYKYNLSHYINTRTELKQCIIQIQNHNKNPMHFEERSLW